ncbi:MAG: 3-deoxy-D-manno-octulosonic acid transferase [Gemmatales bacterium]|nr:3-deoxy-D-manno-octulosonic acid transferase [Gemmatales bacterium]MDW8387523.1 3-deoxy-D-manno-octulosonic acid transferase [Gemmatales bacterium]
MPKLLDVFYLLLLVVVSPWLAYKAIRTGKYRVGLWRKFWGLTPIRTGSRPCVWFHAVSVGEVLLLRPILAGFRRRWPDWEIVLSTTTNTGFEVARKTFPDLCVFYWPLDFSWAVRRALRRIRPSLVVLAELELWPNFIRLVGSEVPVVVVNGRMSPRSYRGYRRIRPLIADVFRRLCLVAVQTEEYAQRMRSLGVPPERVHVTGSVKFDGVNVGRDHPRTRELARLLALRQHPEQSELVWLVGSTQAPEEQIALDIYRRAVERFPQLRLILVPRHAERFDEVAALVEQSGLPLLRRSHLTHPDSASGSRQASGIDSASGSREASGIDSASGSRQASGANPIILLDTLGELAAAWGLADVGFVGGSLSRRGGQNMIEPAACGVAVTFGPHVWNFRDTVERLLENQAAIQVADAAELEQVTLRLLGDEAERRRLGEAARRLVLSQQGATERTLDLLHRLLASGEHKSPGEFQAA